MQNMKSRCLLLFASPYSITQTIDGVERTNEGVSAYFVLDDNLAPRIDEEAAARGQQVYGIKPSKMNLPYAAAAKIKAAPGLYDCTIKMVNKRVDVRGSSVELPTLQIIDLDFAGTIEVQQGMMESTSKKA